jgi:hypothetical protein
MFFKKKEILALAPTWVSFEDISLSEKASHTRTNKYSMFLLCRVPRVIKFIETERRMVASRGGAQRTEELFRGQR